MVVCLDLVDLPLEVLDHGPLQLGGDGAVVLNLLQVQSVCRNQGGAIRQKKCHILKLKGEQEGRGRAFFAILPLCSLLHEGNEEGE